MKNTKWLVAAFVALTVNLSAQIPSGYYDGTDGLTGTELKQTLKNIIDGHNSQSYSALWDHFLSTDRKSNNKVWDMYSDVPGGTPPYEFSFVSDQCGSYQVESDCYNREHSWPKSWFNEDYPMNTDIMHIVPTDGYVNGQRGNNPYGEVDRVLWESENGSKVGLSGFSIMTGTVFEPIDTYKGDFARIYFYMSTRYYNDDNGWYENDLVDGANLTPVGVALLMKWHQEDPVSQKEIDRNNAIYEIQGNRNPFVDHPEFARAIWDEVDVPPYFVSSVSDTVMKEGEQLELDIAFVDDAPQAVNVEVSCLFCTAEFVNVSYESDTLYTLTLAPQSGDQGEYSLVVVVNDGVNAELNTMFTLTVEEGNGLEKYNRFYSINNNPANTSFTIDFKQSVGQNVKMMVYSTTGQIVEQLKPEGVSKLSFGDSYAPGTYILKAFGGNLNVSHKLIKQ
ncbi:MAG: endonuclease [Salinivirgaceae bacterium]|jgi:endonuclease I|nr:endonuclease [Salinivirgaceae bacterium]